MSEKLTCREKVVLRAYAMWPDDSMQQIADRLRINWRTVDKHLANCRKKLGVHTTLSAVLTWLKLCGKLMLLLLLCGCVTRTSFVAATTSEFDVAPAQFIAGDLQSSAPAIGVVMTAEKPVVIVRDGLGNVVGRYWNSEPEVYGTSVLLVPGTDAGSGLMWTRKLWPSVEAPQFEEGLCSP